MKATAWNQKTIAEFHAKQGLGVGMWGDHSLASAMRRLQRLRERVGRSAGLRHLPVPGV
jgi:hypothetical protein